jgi:hypothetical protein
MQSEPMSATYLYAGANPARYVDPSGLGQVRTDDATSSHLTWDIPLNWRLIKNAVCLSAMVALMIAPVPPTLKLAWLTGYILACFGREIGRDVAKDPQGAAKKVVIGGVGCITGGVTLAEPVRISWGWVTTLLGRGVVLSTPQARAAGCIIGAGSALIGIRNPTRP